LGIHAIQFWIFCLFKEFGLAFTAGAFSSLNLPPLTLHSIRLSVPAEPAFADLVTLPS
jgi:hypothetical protein